MARDELEMRVQERTAELNQSNQVLQAEIAERKQAEEALKESEERFSKAFQSNPVPASIRRLADERYQDVNEAFLSFTGFTREEVIGHTIRELNLSINPNEQQDLIQQLRNGKPVRNVECRLRTKDGTIKDEQMSMVMIELAGEACILTTGLDITEHKQAEELIRRQSARAQTLADITKTFFEAGLDYQSVLDTVTRQIAELVGDRCVILLFSEDEQRSIPVAWFHKDPRALSVLTDIFQNWSGKVNPEFNTTILSGGSIFIPVVNPETYPIATTPDIQSYIDQVGISSALIVPLRNPSRVIGYVVITRDIPGKPYTPEDHVLRQYIADRAALTIENARLFQSVTAQKERLRALSARLVEARESERRMIARELHDEISQLLTGLEITLKMIGRCSLVPSGKMGFGETAVANVCTGWHEQL